MALPHYVPSWREEQLEGLLHGLLLRKVLPPLFVDSEPWFCLHDGSKADHATDTIPVCINTTCFSVSRGSGGSPPSLEKTT